MMAPFSALCEQIDYNIAHLDPRSYHCEIYCFNHDDYDKFSGKIKHVPHFKANNWKTVPTPCARTFT